MKTILISIKITLAFCVILAVGYVSVLYGFAALFAPNGGQAEVIKVDGKIVGAANVGQQFTDSTYFWGRPSAVDYNGGGSGGSNKGPSNPAYLDEVNKRIEIFLAAHPYLERSALPSELVTASGSGLDPHISPEGAMVQIGRVAEVRGLSEDVVNDLVLRMTKEPLIGERYINLLELNIALNALNN